MSGIMPINPTTYEVGLPFGDKVEIGDNEAGNFKPHLKLNRWDGECFIKVGLPITDKRTPVVEGDKVKWIEPNREAHFYPFEPRIVGGFLQNELGGFEFEIILKKKPAKNTITLDIETQGLKFYYQPELTPKEIADGAVRPDNVVGSYAVYHATRTPMHRGKADAEKYKAGKAFHIYRPKVKDAVGGETWADLSLDERNGKLVITVDQTWLDRAVYPVSIDPNFGYETIGSTSLYPNANCLIGSLFTSPAGGNDGVSMSAYVKHTWSSSYHIKGVVVLHSNLNIITNGITDAIGVTSTAGWRTGNFSTSPSLSASTEYVLMIIPDSSDIKIYKDTGSLNQGHKDTSNSYASPSNPTDAEHGWSKFSIYCTYEGAGGVTEKSSSDTGSGADAKASGNPVATLTRSEGGSGSDTIFGLLGKLTSDAGSGVDAYVSLEKPGAKTSSDTGSGIEGTPLPSAFLASSESGSGIETFIARLLAAVDTGYGVEAGSVETDGLLKNLLATELGEGSDSLIAKIETPTKGGGMKLWT